MRCASVLIAIFLSVSCGGAPSQRPQPAPTAASSAAPTTIPTTTSVPAALTEFERGAQLRDEGKADQAKAAFDRAIELDPSFAQAYWMRARLLIPFGAAPHALNAQHPAQRDFARALALAAKLPALERAWVE